ncbi:MAG TPA: tripartite tricarboxylate transporter substrate binding protein [Burkholderiaceae bacterium]|nr:tripartite tricarboxylate transporter substrate binding protein [Burkholderiaceae bacterium]
MAHWLKAALVTLALAVAGQGTAQAQAWPARPIKLIVPYPAGGNSDLIGRMIADKIAGPLGQQVVVENRAGAGATIGAQVAARAPADGYTLLLAPTAVMAITHHLRKVPYDPENDFAPIASVSSSYGIVAARKDLPASNMAELVALARREPGKLTFGSAGTATATHLSGEIVHNKAGIKVLHIPYKGSAESLNDLVGGRIDLIYDPVALVQIKAGNLKALGVTSAVRHPELPGVPTLKEQGLEVPGGSWFGLFAPRGTPPEIINRVAAEVERAMAAPGVREQLVKFSQYPEYRGPAAFAAEIRADSAFYKDLIQRLGIKVE